MSTVLITAGITIYTEDTHASFFKKMFGSSDDKTEETNNKKQEEVKEKQEKKEKSASKKKEQAKKKKSKEEKESKETEAKDTTDVQTEDDNALDKARDEDDIKKELEKQKQDDKEMEAIKNESKIAIKFKDGTTITNDNILTEIAKIGPIAQKMSYNDLRMLLLFKAAYEKVITDEAKRQKLDEDEEFKKSLEDRITAMITLAFLAEQSDKLMTKPELKKFYDDLWDKTIKGTHQASLIMIQVPNKKLADQIKSEVKSEADLNKIIKKLQELGNKNIATYPLDDYPEQALPAEIANEIKKQGKNAVVGPFQIHGIFTLFFVKSVHKAKKQELSDEMIPNLKQLASSKFSTQYINNLMKEYNVEIYDLNGDKIDIEKQKQDKKDKKKKKQPPMLSKIKDTQVIAEIKADKAGRSTKLTVADLYKLFNIKSLDNEIFGSLAMQLKVSIEDVIQHAIQLCVQNKLLLLEVQKENYRKTERAKKMAKEVTKQHLRNAYLAKNVKITEALIRTLYDQQKKKMKAELKDDNEISLKLMFYKSAKEAEAAIKNYRSNPKKFNDDFAAQSKKRENVLDVGYVKRQDVPQEIWDVIKKCTPGTCVNTALTLEGSLYGFSGHNFAIAWVSDRRHIQFPALKEVKGVFRKLAEKMQAVSKCDELMAEYIISIDGKQYSKIPAELRNKLLMAIIQGDMKSEQMINNLN